jgi:hypothetical protein
VTAPTQSELVGFEIQRLMRALEALTNPACCVRSGTSSFQVIGRDGRPTGEQVTVCEGCGRELRG